MKPLLLLLTGFGCLSPLAAQPTRFVDAETHLAKALGAGWKSTRVEVRKQILERLAESLPRGGAMHLPESVACGELDFRGMADGVQLTGGRAGTLVLGRGQQGVQMIFCDLNLRVEEGVWRDGEKWTPWQEAAQGVDTFRTLDPKAEPMSNLLALFCEGSIQVNADVRHCHWICGANAFGERTVTAKARIDDSLFLWFGINWPFKDYNAHLDPKRAGTDWSKNDQMHLDLKGGGEGTRLYLMVETNYGNPGAGVVLENAKGVALYQGTTERASSQGGGVYQLKNCERVQLGLRGLNAFANVDHYFRCAMPTHDLTITGGKGNILHGVRFWNHAMKETLVNTDPALQVWACSFQYETKGMQEGNVLRFAVNAGDQLPQAGWVESQRAHFETYADWQIQEWRKLFKIPAGDPAMEDYAKKLRGEYLSHFARGRFHNLPLTAKAEETLVVGGKEVIRDSAVAVPPPPAVPPTKAPQLERPLEFTQQPNFGEALLAAGADPSGKLPSDDAFAKVMYGVDRATVAEWLAEGDRWDAAYRAARTAKDESKMAEAKRGIDAVMAKFRPEVVTKDEKGKERREKTLRGRMEIPAGTFLLAHPLPMVTWNTLMGAGPERTILISKNPANVVIQRLGPEGGGTIGNLKVVGGRVGLAFLGADHHDPVSPTRHSYVAGSNVFKVHFQDQQFAGIWVGQEPAEVMGGAEHDQNKYVQLRFENTGAYGIYMNQNMLDKWLCLNSHFSGQKQAGIRIAFNNVIKGAVIGCRFENINGPGFDCFGGNPEISYTPSLLMMDECEFLECGSATHPAVDLGLCTLSAFCHSRILTKGKEILVGLRSAAQIYDEIFVDVNVPEGRPAVELRAVRDITTARANGHTVRKFTANGPLRFINDSNANLESYAPTMQKVIASAKARQALGHAVPDPGPINFDNNPMKFQNPPQSGWHNPYFFHECKFGGTSFRHHLVNADTGTGVPKQVVELKR
jgi:hypothetical protein